MTPPDLDNFTHDMHLRLNDLMFEIFEARANGEHQDMTLGTFPALMLEYAQREYPGLTAEQLSKAQMGFCSWVIDDLKRRFTYGGRVPVDPGRPYLPGVNQCPNCNVGGCQGCDGNGR